MFTYYSTDKVWLDSLYLPTEKKLIAMPASSFIDAVVFAHLPRLNGQLKDGDDPQKVMWLSVSDESIIFEGYINMDIKIITTQSK